MLSQLLRQLLFTLIHLVVNVLVAVQNVYQRILDRTYSFRNNEVTKSEIKLILKHMPRIRKPLKHLVVLADSDHHSFSDLARVVIWSLVAGIPFISIHDISGKLKENDEDFFHEVERCKKGVPGCIKWSNKPDLNGYTNGIQAHTITVHIFTVDDGRPTLAKCVQQIAGDKLVCDRECDEFTAQELDKVLSLIYPSIPDPNLVLYSGPLCCTHGLLPWQIRLTEFVQLSSNHSVHVYNYLGALYKYNKCDQRFGK